MARCPRCHRRLAPSARCPRDDVPAAAVAEATEFPAPPAADGLEVTALLGAGAFGAVWEARLETRAGDRSVALKVSHATDEATAARFQREAAVLAQVGPPHVPALVASGRLPDGRIYLAMERLTGRTLADELAALPDPPPPPRVAALGAALIDAVAGLHRQGVFHRDLKPENVFLIDAAPGAAVRARLIDFGLSLGEAVADAARTTAGVALGTPEYMAPERIAGQDGDLRADVYALGVMLFELHALRPPFVGERREVEYAHLSFRPPAPSGFAPLPAELEAAILRCLAKEPDQRFADAVALQQAVAGAWAALHAGATSPVAAAARVAAPAAGAPQKVALLFLHLEGPAAEVQSVVLPFGGQVAHLQGERCACVFDHRAGDHPGQRALAAAEALVAAGLSRRLIVDVATVGVKVRPQGPPRFASPLFASEASYSRPEDRDAILLTRAARETLPTVPGAPAPGRPDHVALVPREHQDLWKTVELTSRDATGVVFGRDQELDALLAEAAQALATSHPRVASVLGEQGLGKTRLRLELAQRLSAQQPDAEVVELEAREATGGQSDGPMAELLRRAFQLPEQPPPGDALALLQQHLGHAGGEAAASGVLLGWLSPDDPAVQPLRAAPGALRANAARAGGAALARLAQQRPLVVLIDGAQWADDTLLDALERTSTAELPLWICAFARPAFADSRPTWGERAGGPRRLTLRPLDREDATDMCRYLLEPATHVPQVVLDRLVERTAGVPLLIADLIRGLRRDGLLREQTGGVWVVASEVLDRLADSPLTQWLAGRELDQLPAELAAHARLLSLLPTDFTLEEAEGVLAAGGPDLAATFPLDARVGTRRLAQAGLLRRQSEGGFSFRTQMLRESVAATVPPALARQIHRAALAHHRGGGPARPSGRDDDRARLAWHAAAAGEREVAAATYLALAGTARQRHAYLEAELDYSRSLDLLGDDQGEGAGSGSTQDRLTALRGRGTMRYRLGRFEASRADFAAARALAERIGDAPTQAWLLLDESEALDWLSDWEGSRRLVERARELVPVAPTPLLEASIRLGLGRSLHRINRGQEAAELLREAERLAEQVGDAGYEVRVIAGLLLGHLLPFLGLLDEAEQRLRRVQALCEATGDELHLGGTWNNLSCLWMVRNDRDRFLADNARARDHARRLGFAGLESQAVYNCGNFLYWRGELAAALPHARRAVEIDERYYGQAVPPAAHVLLARILWCQGAEADAARLVADIGAHQTAARAAGQNDLLLVPNDEVMFDMLTLLQEGGPAAAWEALVARGRDVVQPHELIELLELAGVAAERRQDAPAARRWWQDALERCQQIPNSMSDRISARMAALESGTS
jgi:eukaryotic-like serine/threonine-protein kinase